MTLLVMPDIVMEATVTPAGIWIVIVSPSMERMRSQHHATLAIQSVEAAQSIPIASRVAGLGQPWSMVIIKEQAQGAQRESHDIVRLWQRRELGLIFGSFQNSFDGTQYSSNEQTGAKKFTA